MYQTFIASLYLFRIYKANIFYDIICFHLYSKLFCLLPSTFLFIVTLRKGKFEHLQDFTIIEFRHMGREQLKNNSIIQIRNISTM
jgi:hypothetical protein